MQIYQNNSKTRTRKRRTTFLFIIVALILFLLVLHIFNPIFPKQVVRTIFHPLLSSQGFVEERVSGVVTYFSSKQSLEETVQMLQEENMRLEVDKLILTSLLTDQSEQSFEETNTNIDSGKTEKVLVRPPYTPFDTLILTNKGNSFVGDAVYSQGVFIGFISEVSEASQMATLFSASAMKTPVRIGSIDAEATGIGAGTIVATVPKDSSYQIGDPVFTIATGTQATIGLLGAVTAQEIDESGSFARLFINHPLSLQSLEYVTVVPR